MGRRPRGRLGLRVQAGPLALAPKVLADAAFAFTLGREEWAENKALCWYCQAATVASLASVPLVLPEAGRALKRLLGR